jgi:hypothetical protein
VFFKASSDKGKGFVIAYLEDRTSNLFDGAGYVATSTGKLYPYMIQKVVLKKMRLFYVLFLSQHLNRNGYFHRVNWKMLSCL